MCKFTYFALLSQMGKSPKMIIRTNLWLIHMNIVFI